MSYAELPSHPRSALVAYTVPFFASVIGLVASVGDVSAAFTLPCLFALAVATGPQTHSFDRLLCATLVAIGLLLTVVGLYSSLHHIVRLL